MANYLPVFLSKTLSGWPAGTPRYYVYQTGECDSAAALINAMSDPQRLAATVASLPAAAPGKHWVPRACSAAAVVSSVSCVESNGHTLMTVTSTGACEINITATGGGAVWGDATTWYPVTLNSSGQYVKDWTFYFEPGTYHIQARPSGSANSATYKSTDFTAVAKGGGGGGAVSTNLNEHLGPEPAWTGQTFVSNDGNPDLMAIVVAENADRKLIFSNSVPYSSSTAFEIYLLDGRGSNAQPEGASRAELATMPGERGVQHTIERRQIKNGTPPNLWNNQNYMEGAPCISQVIRY